MASMHIDDLFRLLGANEFLPHKGIISALLPGFCEKFAYACETLIELFCGWNRDGYDPNRMQVRMVNDLGPGPILVASSSCF